MMLKRIFFLLICFTSISMFNVRDIKAENVTVGGVTITLPSMWRLENDPPVLPGKIAVRMEDKGMYSVQIGEMLAAELAGNIDKESSELLASAQQNENTFKVINSGTFDFEGDMQGKFVLLSINAIDSNYRAPLMFYSVYVPKPNGNCVTFKLRCGNSEFKYLKDEFDQIILGAKIEIVNEELAGKKLGIKKW